MGKKKWQKWSFGIICVALFLTFRLNSILKEHEKPVFDIPKKPHVLKPTVVRKNQSSLLPLAKQSENAQKYFAELLVHPWIQAQTGVEEISHEMIQDIEGANMLCEALQQETEQAGKKPLSTKKITKILIETLLALQNEIPISFPDNLYSVLCITETADSSNPPPTPFHVYKRLYLGQTEIGFPFYLDVRVFDVESEQERQNILSWHCSVLVEKEDAFEKHIIDENKQVFLGKGVSAKNRAHGVFEWQDERGVFIYAIQKGKKLYVAYTDASWKTFEKSLNLFSSL